MTWRRSRSWSRVELDLDRPETIDAALRGVDHVLAVSPMGLEVPDAPGATGNIGKAAVSELAARGAQGADQPSDTNRTAEGRRANRRIELVLIDPWD